MSLTSDRRGGRISLPLSGRALAFVALALAAAGPEPRLLDWHAKVHASLRNAPPAAEQDLLVVLEDQADLRGAAALPTKAEKGRYVYERLTAAAERSQGPLRKEFEARGLSYQSFWVTNMVAVRGRKDLIEALAQRPEVRRIEPNPAIPGRLPLPERIEPTPGKRMESVEAVASGPEWNLTKVGAPSVWAAGDTGQGVVVAGADTGYEWTHPALKGKYRGWSGSTADHNYNWHDAVHDAVKGNPCKSNSQAPCDDDDHGTHTMGIMVGDDGAGNQVGMAPGAKWIGCRNMDEGTGTPARYTECFQWFIAPTDLNGNNPDPSKSPDVINNSWDCPPSEGCANPDTLKSVIESVRAAGIAVFVAGGNDGPGCNVMDVPETYEASISVGSTDSSDAISGFSSRGPGQNGIIKPEIVAPGSNIRSSVRGGGYAAESGTSMASPHAAGMAALLLSADPSLSGNVTGLEALMEQTAVAKTTTDTCGGVAAGIVPNNSAGYGRIDALAGYQSATAPNVDPSISITSPSNGAVYTAFATIPIAANASDGSGGHVVRVDFFSGSTKLATVTSAPYSYVWTTVGAGSYVLTAVATDNQGVSVPSAPVSVTVNPGAALPDPWVSGEVGSVGIAGSGVYVAGTFTVKGSGLGISGSSDQFHYVYQPFGGDGQIVARVVSLQDPSLASRGGVMLRESLASGSKEVSMLITAGGRWTFARRTATGASTSQSSGDAPAPRWVRLVRSGTTVSASYSLNGVTWSSAGSVSVSMAADVFVGLALTSQSNGALATGTFDGVVATSSAVPTATATPLITSTPIFTPTHTPTRTATPTPSATRTPTPTPTSDLPPPWVSGDVGTVGLPGSGSAVSGTFTVKGSGLGIMGTSDQFQYVSQPLNGNGQIVARVVSVQDTGVVSKGGVMIRETLATGSKEVSMLITGNGRWMFMRRTATDATTSYSSGAAPAPRWVKLVRSGSTLSGSYSLDGVSWTSAGSVSVSMATNVFVGLVMTSQSNTILATATFDGVAAP